MTTLLLKATKKLQDWACGLTWTCPTDAPLTAGGPFCNVSALAYIRCYENKVNSNEPYQTWLWGSKQFNMLFATLQFYSIRYQRVRINRKRGWVCFPLHNAHKSSNWLASVLGSLSAAYSARIGSPCCTNAYSHVYFQHGKNEKALLYHVQKQIHCKHDHMQKYSLQSFSVNAYV